VLPMRTDDRAISIAGRNEPTAGQSRLRLDRTIVPMPEKGPVRAFREADLEDDTISVGVEEMVASGRRGLCAASRPVQWQLEDRTMTAHVWISDCRADSTLIIPMGSDFSERRPELSEKAGLMRLLGQTVPADMLPRILWGKTNSSLPRKLPHFFVANGNWLVSRKAADVISQFDLGDGGLYPVQIFKKDRTTPVEGEFLCLNVGAQKSAFLPEQSPRVAKCNPELPWWTLPPKDKDDAASVSSTALQGPDLWWDRTIDSGFFLSGPLGDALKKAGLAKAFRLYRCPVVEGRVLTSNEVNADAMIDVRMGQ
jgi:hypothetical protein